MFQTNYYRIQRELVRYKPVDNDEIKAFIGIILVQGYNVLPKYHDYWSERPDLGNNLIRKCLSRNRFYEILRMIHLNENDKCPSKAYKNYEKLFKVRPLIELSNKIYQTNYTNSAYQVIDESMIKFKGRSSIKQYLPKKPIKRGFKMWARCCSETGYLFEYDIYLGKSVETSDSVSEKVVIKIT